MTTGASWLGGTDRVSCVRRRVRVSCRPPNRVERPLIAAGVGDLIAAYYRADGIALGRSVAVGSDSLLHTDWEQDVDLMDLVTAAILGQQLAVTPVPATETPAGA